MKAKIIETAFWLIPLSWVISTAIKYVLAYLDCVDDELMFIYGFNLIIATCVIVLGSIIGMFIFEVWKKPKK